MNSTDEKDEEKLNYIYLNNDRNDMKNILEERQFFGGKNILLQNQTSFFDSRAYQESMLSMESDDYKKFKYEELKVIPEIMNEESSSSISSPSDKPNEKNNSYNFTNIIKSINEKSKSDVKKAKSKSVIISCFMLNETEHEKMIDESKFLLNSEEEIQNYNVNKIIKNPNNISNEIICNCLCSIF